MDQVTASELDQQRQGYFHSDPCIPPRGTGITQPNIRTVVAASGNTSSHDSHYLTPDTYDNGSMYLAQYNAIQPQHNLNMGVAATPNMYYAGMNTCPMPMPLNHRAVDLPGSSTYAVSVVSADNFGRSASFMDDARGPYKRKIAEGMRGNYHYFNASGSSSTAPPNAARHPDGVPVMDAASFSLHVPSLVEVGPHGNAWTRPGESIMVQDHNNLIRGNYLGQHFQPAAPPWLDPQLNSNSNDGHVAAWNQPLPMAYVQAPGVNGSSLESATMGLPRYHEAPSNRNGLRFPHPPPVNHQHPSYPHPALPMQVVRGPGVNFHPPIAAASFRVPTNPSRGGPAIPVHAGFEMGPRQVGPVPAAGFRIYRPHRGVMQDAAIGHRNLSPMGFLHVDDVALMDEVGNLVDHHRDMRMDIEDMSYEDLLALGERIGNVSTGLSDETIANKLKTKTYLKPASAITSEEAASDDRDAESCIICQDEYKNQEMIGVLRCEHEYHVDCLKKWLLVKNVCPVCKSEALIPGSKDV